MEIVRNLTVFGYLIELCLLIAFAIKFYFDLIIRKKSTWIWDVKILINLGITILTTWYIFIIYAMIVRLPVKIEYTSDKTIQALKYWLIENLLMSGIKGALIIILISGITYILQMRFERNNSIKFVARMSLINIFILTSTLIIIYFYTLDALSYEVGHHFK
jgi:hypothetical protein